MEAILDASYSGALAPSALINFVVSASTNATDGVDLSEMYIVDNNLGDAMTESFGSCEEGVTSAEATSISNLAEQAAAQGITYMVSAGDDGSAGCDDPNNPVATQGVSVNILASSPYTVAVGGTMFNDRPTPPPIGIRRIPALLSPRGRTYPRTSGTKVAVSLNAEQRTPTCSLGAAASA